MFATASPQAIAKMVVRRGVSVGTRDPFAPRAEHPRRGRPRAAGDPGRNGRNHP